MSDNNPFNNNFNNFNKINFGEGFNAPNANEPSEVKPEVSQKNGDNAPQKEEPKKGNNSAKNTGGANIFDNKRDKRDEERNHRLRLSIYIFTLIICLGLLFNQNILNTYYLSVANDALKSGNYQKAFKNYKSAFSTKINNEKQVKNYFLAMEHLEFVPIVQHEMIRLKNEYKNPEVNKAIQNIIAKERQKIFAEAGINYIDNTTTNANVIHWNSSVPVVVRLEENTVPDFYLTQIKNAFIDWSVATNNDLTFDFNNDKKPNIEITFVDNISGATERYGKKIAILGSTEPYYTGKNLIKTRIKFKKTDVDDTTFTENQIYNLALHEIGHALGISGHSFNKADAMYPMDNAVSYEEDTATLLVTKRMLSESDRNTIKLFYKIIPDITNVKYFDQYKKGYYYPEIVLGNIEEVAQKKLEESQSYMKLISGNYISYMDLGEGNFATKNYQEAKNAFLAALKLAKENIEYYNAYYNLAVTSYEEGKYQDAIDYATLAKKYAPDRKSNEIIGFSYIKLKKMKEAEREFEQLVLENPDNVLFSYTLTNLYFSRFKFLKAIGEMKRIKSVNPHALADDIYTNYRFLGIFI